MRLQPRVYLLLVLSFLLPAQSWSVEPIALYLAEGESQVVRGRGTVRVGRSQVVRAIEAGGQIHLLGRKVGTVTVSFEDRAYFVTVVPRGQLEFLRQIQELLASRKGLTALLNADLIHINGQLLRCSDWQDLSTLASGHRQYPIRFQARVVLNIRQECLALLKGLARSRGLQGPELTRDGRFELHIGDSAANAPDYAAFYGPWGIEPQRTGSLLLAAPLVRVQLTVAEISKSAGSALGLAYGDNESVQVLPKFKAPQEISATLRLLEAKGAAHILARPQITTRSGSEGEFLSGGEFPMRGGSHKNREVTWKRHGLWLKVKPEVFANDLIRLEISNELSVPDMSQAVDGIPGVKTTRVQAQLDLAPGHTLALSGLSQVSRSTHRAGLPGLASLPLVGGLFGTELQSREEMELVILITPEVKSAQADDSGARPQGSADEL